MRATLLALCSIYGIVGFADDAVSPAFTFDARYKSSGITPDAWVSYEAEGLSSRSSAATNPIIFNDWKRLIAEQDKSLEQIGAVQFFKVSVRLVEDKN